MIITFSWTTFPLLSGFKTQTWRSLRSPDQPDGVWNADYATRFHAGQIVDAYDRNPRLHGTKVAVLELEAAPQFLLASDTPPEFYFTEGLQYLYLHPELCPRTLHGKKFHPSMVTFDGFCTWRAQAEQGFLVSFRVLEVVLSKAAEPYHARLREARAMDIDRAMVGNR